MADWNLLIRLQHNGLGMAAPPLGGSNNCSQAAAKAYPRTTVSVLSDTHFQYDLVFQPKLPHSHTLHPANIFLSLKTSVKRLPDKYDDDGKT